MFPPDLRLSNWVRKNWKGQSPWDSQMCSRFHRKHQYRWNSYICNIVTGSSVDGEENLWGFILVFDIQVVAEFHPSKWQREIFFVVSKVSLKGWFSSLGISSLLFLKQFLINWRWKSWSLNCLVLINNWLICSPKATVWIPLMPLSCRMKSGYKELM